MARAFLKAGFLIIVAGCVVSLLSGCTVVFQKGRTSDIEKINALSEKLKALKMTEEELDKLQKAYLALEKSLKKEIGEDKVSLGIEQKGLVITFVDSILFDSGRDELRSEAHSTLDKVADVGRNIVGDREIGIEGHTDNQPIKYSGWKSNWELSNARALSVLHYLIDKNISPERLSATGYGEYRPVASNFFTAGRDKNRRVEIVVLPGKILRVRPQPVQSTTMTKQESKVDTKAVQAVTEPQQAVTEEAPQYQK